MKRLALLITLLLGLTAAAVSANAADLPQIAVYVTGSVPDNEKKVLGTRMLSALVKSGRYRGIERSESFLAEIDKEHVKQRSGAIDDSQISELGKQFGVQYICIADITPAYNAYQVSARIINVETAEVAHIGEAFSPLRTPKDLRDVSDQVVKNMFGEPTTFWAAKPKTIISAGGGLLAASEFGGGLMWIDEPKERIKMPYLGIGAYLFIDAKYVYAAVSFLSGGQKWESANVDNSENLPDMQRTSIGIGLYAKYPFMLDMEEKIALFPLAGFSYEMSVSGKLARANGSDYVLDGKDKRPEASALNATWGKFGVGADYSLNNRAYLRAELLYGLRGANAFEEDMAESETSAGEKAEAKSGAGIFLKIGAGLRF